jgi:hypothetical protein
VLGLVALTTVLHTLTAYEGARYLVPLVLCAAALAGALLAHLGARRRYGRPLAVLVALACLGVANLSLYPQTAARLGALHLADLDETQLALAALQQRGLDAGYADYWTAYPITYLSDERVLVAPMLPFFWRARTDRYPAFTRQVDSVADAGRLFALVDERCAIEPYLQPLTSAGAHFRVDEVARWRLVWDLKLPAGAEARTLAGWRAAIETQPTC